MQPTREPRPSDIFDEIARGTKLEQTLSLIALKATIDLKAPTCKIWVVKHGDICERCPLADVCTNRQMCLHLLTAVGAEMENEYPRIPLSVLNATLIARGGVADFKEADTMGEKLFGIQQKDFSTRPCSYALYPLKGITGTVGVIGVFNDRLIEADELQILAQLAPAAVAAIRVAELQARCVALRQQLENGSDVNRADTPEEASEVAQLKEASTRLEEEKERLGSDINSLEQQVAAASREKDELTRRLEMRERQLIELQSEITAYREQGAATRESHEAATMKAESDAVDWQRQARQQSEKIALLEATNSELRDNISALSETLDDKTSALHLAENSRARLEQEQIKHQEKIADMTQEMERLMRFQNQMRQETANLLSENERLRGGMGSGEVTVVNTELQEQLQAAVQRLNEVRWENARLKSEYDTLQQRAVQLEEVAKTCSQQYANLEAQAAMLDERADAFQQENEQLRQQNAELQHHSDDLHKTNAQLQEALKQLETMMPQLAETTDNLRERVAVSERLCTELEQRNRELSDDNQQLAHKRQGQADLLATISHEIRTLLHSIVGFTSLLIDDASLALNDKQRRNLERVAATSRELADFVNKILDYSKIEAGRMSVYAEAVDVRDLIARVVGIAEGLKSGASTMLVTEVASDVSVIRTDRAKLQQILLNLLSNAVKFTRQGKIEVLAERANAEQIHLIVRDTGIGIAEGEVHKIFDDFYQVMRHATKPGSGLGLAITRRLVNLLGGDITVSSRPGEGTTFTVTLPLAIESREAAGLEIAASDHEHTALVIGTDAPTLYLTRKYLSAIHYSVATTGNLSHGLELMRMAKPSLVVVDLDALDNHADALTQLASHKDDSRLLALSVNPNLQLRAINSGADHFLHKPLERDTLLALIMQSPTPAESFILVVDDDADAREIMMAILEMSGYRVETATNGREALEAMRRARPQLLILDLMMPEMDGFEVEHRLRLNPNWREIPVLLMTARDLTNEERAALADGATRVRQKGNINREDLLREVSAAIHKDGTQ